jgi:hypothetical protein
MAAKLCNVCNKRRAYTGSKGTETAAHGSGMCNYCFEEGGWENSHGDNGHADILDALDGVQFGLTTHKTKAEYEAWLKEAHAETDMCWICHPELNLAQRPTHPGQHGKQGSFTRRPQLNHKGHSHPQTPAARRACKQAFWKVRGEQGITPANVEAKHFASWDFNSDGNGKQIAIEQVKAGSGWAGVAPLGPKGGTGASVKAAGAKVSELNGKAKPEPFSKRLGKVEKGLAKAAGLVK